MDALVGYDKDIKQRTLTLHFTEPELHELHDLVSKIHNESYVLLAVLDNFFDNDMIVSSVDGENGDVMVPRREA